jgi:hypothetical protein
MALYLKKPGGYKIDLKKEISSGDGRKIPIPAGNQLQMAGKIKNSGFSAPFSPPLNLNKYLTAMVEFK